MSGYQSPGSRRARVHYYAMFMLPIGAVLTGLVRPGERSSRQARHVLGGGVLSWAAFELCACSGAPRCSASGLCFLGCVCCSWPVRPRARAPGS